MVIFTHNYIINIVIIYFFYCRGILYSITEMLTDYETNVNKTTEHRTSVLDGDHGLTRGYCLCFLSNI